MGHMLPLLVSALIVGRQGSPPQAAVARASMEARM